MEFNLDKGNAVHFGSTSKDRACTMNGRVLGSTREQRDLGVQIQIFMNVAVYLCCVTMTA